MTFRSRLGLPFRFDFGLALSFSLPGEVRLRASLVSLVPDRLRTAQNVCGLKDLRIGSSGAWDLPALGPASAEGSFLTPGAPISRDELLLLYIVLFPGRSRGGTKF